MKKSFKTFQNQDLANVKKFEIFNGEFKWQFSPVIHDRIVKLDNGWIIKIGRGLDIYRDD